MKSSTTEEQIRQFRCFTALSDQEAQALVEQLELIEIAAGQELFHEADPGDSVYLLLSGHVEIRIAVPDHPDRVLSVLDPGAIFGEISLLLNEPRTASAVALIDAKAWKIDREIFHNALDKQEPWAIKFLLAISKVLARRLGTVDHELVWIITDMHTHEEKPQVTKAHELENLRNRLFTQWSF